MYFWTEFTKPYAILVIVIGFVAGSVFAPYDPMFGMAVAWVMTPAACCVVIYVKLIFNAIVRAKRLQDLDAFVKSQRKAIHDARV